MKSLLFTTPINIAKTNSRRKLIKQRDLRRKTWSGKKVVKFNLKLRLDSLPHSIISCCSSTDQIFQNNHSHKLFLPYWISHHTKNLPVSTSLYISLSQVRKKSLGKNILEALFIAQRIKNSFFYVQPKWDSSSFCSLLGLHHLVFTKMYSVSWGTKLQEAWSSAPLPLLQRKLRC